MRHAFFGEDAPAATLGAERKELRIGAVHWNAEPDGQIALQRGGVVGHKMRAVKIENQRSDVIDQARAF